MADFIAGNTGTSGVVAAGSFVTGTIDVSGDEDWYRVNASNGYIVGHTYSVDLLGFASSQGTLSDPFLRLMNGVGAQQATDDDSGTGLESRLTFTYNGGDLFLSAQGFGTNTGTFRLTTTDITGGGDVLGSTGTGGTVAVGGAVTGTIETGGDQDWYQVTLTAGHQYRFNLQGYDSNQGTLGDTFLRLMNGVGVQLVTDDDSGTGLESSILFTPGVGGTYFLSAEGFGSGFGTFRLSATDLGGTADTVAANTGTGGTVVAGGSVTGATDTNGDQDWYQISLTSGHQYRFDLQGYGSGQGTLFDPLLRLLDASGALVVSNDDSGFTLESSIAFTPSFNGTYFLSAQAFGSDTGTFRLLATDLGGTPDAVAASTGTGGTVAVGGAVTGTIDTNGDQDWYQVSGLVAGHTYRFEQRGATADQGTLIDPLLRLMNGSGGQVDQNDDSSGTLDSGITFAYGGGTYFLSAQGYGTNTGTFELRAIDVTSDAPGNTGTGFSIAPGAPATAQIDFNDDQDWYQVSLTAGHQYRFDLRGYDSNIGTLDDPVLRLMNGSGLQIAFDDDTGLGRESSILFTPGLGGTYFLSAQSFGTAIGSYRLSATDITVSDVPGTLGTGAVLATPAAGVTTSLAGRIELGGDQDWFQFAVTAGQQYRFDLQAYDTNLELGAPHYETLDDPVLRLLNSSGGQLVIDDDSGVGLESSITYSATSNTTLLLSAQGTGSDFGTYTLSATNITNGINGDVASSTAGAVTVPIPLTTTFISLATGSIGTANDQDWWKITLTGGQIYAFDLHGVDSSPINLTLSDPFLRLLDSSGNQLQVDDDSGNGHDSYIIYLDPHPVGVTSTYYISAQSFAVPGYVASTGTYELFGANYTTFDTPQTTGSASTVTVGGSVIGAVNPGTDQDWYGATLTAGQTYVFDLHGIDSFADLSLSDPYLRLLNSSGNQLAFDDDSGLGSESSIVYTATYTGLHFLSVQSYAGSGVGTYQLDADLAGQLFNGTSGDDFLDGTRFNDVLIGFAGDDELDGGEGDDELRGGAGNDRFFDFNGNNVLVGANGDDFFAVSISDGGSDVVTGGAGRDSYQVQVGSASFVITDFAVGLGGDVLDVEGLLAASAASGFYQMGVSSSTDFLRMTQSGPDALLEWDRDGTGGAYTWAPQLTLKSVDSTKLTPLNFTGSGGPGIGTKGDDNLAGSLGNDTLTAVEGNDTLNGGPGEDALIGGPGNDIYFVDDVKDVVVETSNSPPGALLLPGAELSTPPDSELTASLLDGVIDLVISAIDFSLENLEFIENLTLSGNAVNGIGNLLDNVMTGNALANTLSGGSGNDSIWGVDGNDSIVGGDGNDTVQGNAGNDMVRGATGNDEVRGGQGDDTLQAGAGLDVLRGALGNDEMRGGPDNDQMFGGQGNDSQYGGQGNDLLQGLLGNDVLQGLLGNDTLSGGGGFDQFWFNNAGPASVDAITDFDVGGEADTLVLQAVFFNVLAPGALASGNFVSGAGAADGNDYIIYNAGNLYYDADGNGAGAAQLIATLTGAPAITAADFLIVA